MNSEYTTAEGPQTSKGKDKKKYVVCIIAALLAFFMVLLLINHLYCAWRSDSRAIRDYLRSQKKETVYFNNQISYDIFFFDRGGMGFGYQNGYFALYSQFMFNGRIAEVWITFSKWGKLEEGKGATADVFLRDPQSGRTVADLRFGLTKTSEGYLKISRKSDFGFVASESGMTLVDFDNKGHIWIMDLINKTNTYCNNHSNRGGWDLPRVYNRKVSE